jgi:hypothetical protein
MPWRDRYPPDLNTVGDSAELAADAVIYRLAHERIPVAGLPEQVAIGSVTIHFTAGPIVSQVTEMRQRPGWPPVFDKVMRRSVELAAGQPLTICEVASEFPEDIGRAIGALRQQAINALGLVVAMLDERIAGDRVTEDLLLVSDGTAVAAVDARLEVRRHMPFDVEPGDRDALQQLTVLEPSSPAGSAAGLLLAGLREGPTPRGVLGLWLAIDALVGSRRTDKLGTARMLADAGFDVEWLSMSLGRLVGVRGRIAHGVPVDEAEINDAFYDSEAVARALVRQTAGVTGGWPASPMPTAFPVVLGRQIADAGYDEVWHEDELPPIELDPAPVELPRVDAAHGGHGTYLEVTGASSDDRRQRVMFWTMAACTACGLDVGQLRIHIGGDGLNDGATAVNADRILLARDIAEPDDEPGDVRLGLNLCTLVAQMHVMRAGVDSVSLGALLIEYAGVRIAWHEWVTEFGAPGIDLQDPQGPEDFAAGGALAAAAAEGDTDAEARLDAWLDGCFEGPELQEVLRGLLAELRKRDTLQDMLTAFAEMAAAQHELDN